jgi:solute carrier family 35 protein F5
MMLSSYGVGLLFIFLVSVIWSAASVLVQFLYNDHSFDSPFLLTYIGTSLFILFLPSRWIWQRFCGDPSQIIPWQHESNNSSNNHARRSADYESLGLECTATADEETRSHFHDSSLPEAPLTAGDDDDDDDNHHPRHPSEKYRWTELDHVRAAAKIAPVWFISNWAYNASLKYTSITSSTVLASTGSLFAFLFALLMKDESFTYLKLVGVLLGMMGSIITGLHDFQSEADDGSDTFNNHTSSVVADHLGTPPYQQPQSAVGNDDRIWGDILGLISAAGYGSYAVMVRVLCPQDESLMSMQLFLGYVGLCNMVVLSPICLYQLLDSFSRQSASNLTWVVFGFLVLKGLFDNVLSDYLWARAVVLTSATVATVGLGLTIPLAFASDWMFEGRPDVLQPASIVGALSVLAAFVLVNVGAKQEDDDEDSAEADNEPVQEFQGQTITAEQQESVLSTDRPARIIRSPMEYSDTEHCNEIS